MQGTWGQVACFVHHWIHNTWNSTSNTVNGQEIFIEYWVMNWIMCLISIDSLCLRWGKEKKEKHFLQGAHSLLEDTGM